MLRLWGSRRSGKGTRGGPPGGAPVVRPAGKGRRCELSTTPPDTPSRHLLPCHVRLLDGTDLYIQIVVSVGVEKSCC
jgi:hypothetical protein